MADRPAAPNTEPAREPKCVPLCGATKAYGHFDKWWYHEPQCPVRMAALAARGETP